jgi:hypothetical protein
VSETIRPIPHETAMAFIKCILSAQGEHRYYRFYNIVDTLSSQLGSLEVRHIDLRADIRQPIYDEIGDDLFVEACCWSLMRALVRRVEIQHRETIDKTFIEAIEKYSLNKEEE